ASAGCNLRSEMSRLMEAARAVTASGGRGTRNTGRYCPKVVESCPAAANISRGSRFSIPRPLTRPGADSWFVRACRRPAALLHDRPADRSLDGVLESSVSWWAKWFYWGPMGSDRSPLRPSPKLARAFPRFAGARLSQDQFLSIIAPAHYTPYGRISSNNFDDSRFKRIELLLSVLRDRL